jgi:LPPG:FO 2-phospho-L-lactate transferase
MELVVLSGGVGGARMARGLAATPECRLTVVVNVGDDDLVHGLHVAADLDTVVYTLAGVEGPHGWGRAAETWTVMDELSRFIGANTSFRLGDLDLAVNLYRTGRLAAGDRLSAITAAIATGLGVVDAAVIPVTDDRLRTVVETVAGTFDFQTYFVRRRHADAVTGVSFEGAATATPAPGVMAALERAAAIVIAPSNPVLSIWPVLAVPGIRETLAGRRVVAVSPLIGGRAVKGPAAEVMEALGLGASVSGVLAAYDGLVSHLVMDTTDPEEPPPGLAVLRTDTMIAAPEASRRLGEEIVRWLA